MKPRLAAICVVLGCSGAPHGGMPDATVGGDAAAGDAAFTAGSWGERCGNAVDDDGDGLVDEDCLPSLFAGVFAPTVATDPALAAIEGGTQRPLAILQTYHSTSPAGVAKIAPDLAAIFARGQVAHLNLEPAGYTAAQYAVPTSDPIARDLAASADAIAQALVAASDGRVLLTFGAEMNGNWTDWGCLPAQRFIALYRAAHDVVTAKLDAAGIDRRRVRWAYGPNSVSSASCGSAAGYYPGHAYVDLLGMSAYRAGTQSVDAAVTEPMAQLFDALAYPEAWRLDRFVVLQTGSRTIAGDDRDAWIAGLWSTLQADPRAAGIIYFDAADWAVSTSGPGWIGLTGAIAAAPVADRGLEGVFAPHFWDVPYVHPAFGEIQALRDAAITLGCANDPPRFCPDDPITAADAMALVERAGLGTVSLADPVDEAALASLLGVSDVPTSPVRATRARAAVLVAHARLLR